ncbi:SGNH/GDSL hydrolase family protein [Novosphingobium beihaiensis]|uniref:SGNH/GDSL hydrolase family protein n=1 Tax=Novosphingobium beihaiensis TaxID=2930389 RepID=A0ABT0BT61_9SPHN|nr:SGNH/GDSL hydrolase family protein [Novosphingobium beihaiensis]MCJ2188229.1 SGNH/GDSL hydrolase family protein [Novosphingobium beihaiensis]
MKALLLPATAGAAVLLGLGSASSAMAQETGATATASVEQSLEGARYVAMGSSYAAGPLLPPGKPGAPARCGQSLNNYPTLLAERFGMVLVDRSCSGATTNHILGPWGDIPPQIASVDAKTRLVTVTIGGNDLNYVGNLFNATCAFNAKALAASGAKPKACAPVRVPAEADYARDEAQLNEIARRVRAAAPKARLVFVQYLTPLPPAGSLCAVTPVSEENAAIIREIGKRLAEITGRVALANGALVIEMNQASAMHTPCDPEPWMIGAPQGYDGKQGLQWHLNKTGMQMTADGIAYWLIKEGVNPGKAIAPVPSAPSAQPETPSAPEETPAPAEDTVTPEDGAP